MSVPNCWGFLTLDTVGKILILRLRQNSPWTLKEVQTIVISMLPNEHIPEVWFKASLTIHIIFGDVRVKKHVFE